NRWFGKMTGGYVTWSHVLIRRWVLALLLLVGISVVALGMGKGLPSSFIPEEDQGYAFLQLQLPDAASLQRTDAVMRKMNDMLAHTHGVKSFSGISGFSLLSNTRSEEHTSELQSRSDLVCRLLLEKKKISFRR